MTEETREFHVPQIRRRDLRRLSPEAIAAAHAAGHLARITHAAKYLNTPEPPPRRSWSVVADARTHKILRFSGFHSEAAAAAALFGAAAHSGFRARAHRPSVARRRTHTSRPFARHSRPSGDSRDAEPPPPRCICAGCGVGFEAAYEQNERQILARLIEGSA